MTADKSACDALGGLKPIGCSNRFDKILMVFSINSPMTADTLRSGSGVLGGVVLVFVVAGGAVGKDCSDASPVPAPVPVPVLVTVPVLEPST